MNKVWIIARHEYVVNVRRPGFLIMTALIPLLGLILLLIGAFFSGQAGSVLEEVFDGGPEITGVLDQSNLFDPILPDYADRFVLYASEEEGREDVEAEQLRRFLIIPSDYRERGEIKVISAGSTFAGVEIEDSSSLRRFFLAHLTRDLDDLDLKERIVNPYEVDLILLGQEGEGENEGIVSTVLGFIIPYLLGVLLIVTIFVSSGYLLRSVSEEKTNRVIEIILSSVTPRQLLAGKVIGLGALGLTQVLVWIISAFGLSGGVVALLGIALPLMARPEVFVLAVVYYILGFIIYAVMMGSVGALGADMQESQQLAGVFSFLAAVPLMFAGLVFSNPNMPLVRALSWFPFTAPTMMMLRLPLADVPLVDIIVSIISIGITIPIIIWLGAKLFRMGLLMYGKRPGVRQIWEALRAA